MLASIEDEAERYMREHHFSGHDFAHVMRVRRLCKIIGKKENADMLVLEAAALLHDLGREAERKDFAVNHANKSVEIADKILQKVRFPSEKTTQVLYAIKVHRFTQHIFPKTIEAKILQDADRIDISGASGIAMTFAYSGAHGIELYNYKDPFAENRSFDDKQYSIDHFYTKLLKLPEAIHTETGRKIAEKRSKFLSRFLKQLRSEIEGSS